MKTTTIPKTTKTPTNYSSFLAGIDWSLLRDQIRDLDTVYRHMVDKETHKLTDVHAESVLGILDLMDALRDFAVSEYGFAESALFHSELEEAQEGRSQ